VHREATLSTFISAGSIRTAGRLVPGTRTERLPFPCHPRGKHAFLSEFDSATPVQYWEQTCMGASPCGREYRFEHRDRVLSWYPIHGLTNPLNPSAMPLDLLRVHARQRFEASW
jgi:hypothetical protein